MKSYGKLVIFIFRRCFLLLALSGILLLPVISFAIIVGDINNNHHIELDDAILVLQAISDIIPPGTTMHSEATVNIDNRIGMEDAIFVLQILADIRQHPDTDDDTDGYTENQGDCDDTNQTVYPGATETCGDGIDEDCNGEDQQCTPNNIYVVENYNLAQGDFMPSESFTISGGRLRFSGDGSDDFELAYWNGGYNPSNNWYPQPGHSNYFDNFHVSVDTSWDEGELNWYYGLVVCLNKGSSGYDEWISFVISKNGYYNIGKVKNNEYIEIVGWTRSFLLNINGQNNKLAIQKQADHFRFFINNYEVGNMAIEGFQGGAIGLQISEHVDASFDDYTVNDAYQGQIAIPSEGYIQERNELIHKTMTTTYLWYDQVLQIDYWSYASAEDLVRDLRYNSLDKWSYITTKETYDSLFKEGQYLGIGFGLKRVNNNECNVSFVYRNSPADNAGIKRTDTLLEINGKTIAQIDENSLWETVFGEDLTGIEVGLKIRTAIGEIRELTVRKAMVDINAVVHSEIIEQSGTKVGYLVFNKFITTAMNELETVFSDFKGEGIQELIIDLRYNPGGKIYIANYLASMIGGDLVANQVFSKFTHNDRYQVWDTQYHFEKPEGALNLDRLFVITTNDSCSASEMVVNSLQPFINVVMIGDTTCGKPVGMHGYDIFDLHISPIEFKGLNADDIGEYYSGLQPTCFAEDGLQYSFGESGEDSLKHALYYIDNDTCIIEQSSVSALRMIEGIKEKIEPPLLYGFKKEIGAF